MTFDDLYLESQNEEMETKREIHKNREDRVNPHPNKFNYPVISDDTKAKLLRLKETMDKNNVK